MKLKPGECARCHKFGGHAQECGLRSPYGDDGQTWEEVQKEQEVRQKAARDLEHTYRLLGMK